MSTSEQIVTYYLDEYRAGNGENAFHSLVEADAGVIPHLIAIYDSSSDLYEKVFVVDVVSEFRLDSSLGFLSHALGVGEPRIWKAALDGMALAQSPAAVEAMIQVLQSAQDPLKREWIEEAIVDTQAEIDEKHSSPGASDGNAANAQGGIP